jgi:hypothetical protein
MGREKKKKYLSRRLVNYVDIQSAIRKLKIKAFKSHGEIAHLNMV